MCWSPRTTTRCGTLGVRNTVTSTTSSDETACADGLLNVAQPLYRKKQYLSTTFLSQYRRLRHHTVSVVERINRSFMPLDTRFTGIYGRPIPYNVGMYWPSRNSDRRIVEHTRGLNERPAYPPIPNSEVSLQTRWGVPTLPRTL